MQLAVQEVEGKEEDKKGQVEVEEEKRLKEVRSDLEPMRCETTLTGVRECALCARSAYHVHHARVCENVVIGVLVVLCELHVIVRVHVICCSC